MRKLLLGLGTAASLAAPLIVVVISCGYNHKKHLTIEQWKAKYPQYAEGIKGTVIVNNAFQGIAFEEDFQLPIGITEIGHLAFANAVIASYDFKVPGELEWLARDAFKDMRVRGKIYRTLSPTGRYFG